MKTSTILKSILGTTALAGLFIGCYSKVNDSHVKHTPDEPTRGRDAWMWVETPDPDYFSFHQLIAGEEPIDYLSDSNPMTKRLQLWLDGIDAYLRKSHPNDLANVPKPLVKIIENSEPQAFASPMPVCYQIEVNFAADTMPPPLNAVDTVYMDSDGKFYPWDSSYPCVEGTSPEETLRPLVKYLTSKSPACKLTLSGDGTNVALGVNRTCERDPELTDVLQAKKLVISQTSNKITVHTGIIKEMTEPTLVAVLAHELGHYYRSHITAHSSEYDFFYTMDRHNSDRRPIAEPSLKTPGDLAVNAAIDLNNTQAYGKINAQKMRPELFIGAGSAVQEVCSVGSCPKECAQARIHINDPKVNTALAAYPFADIAASDYSDFETAVFACAEKISLVPANGKLTASSISWEKVESMTRDSLWVPSSLAYFLETDWFKGVVKITAGRLRKAAPSNSTLKEALIQASATLDRLDSENLFHLKRAKDLRIGQYTYEQEADDFAAEALAGIGLQPLLIADANAILGKNDETTLDGYQFGIKKCNDLRSKSWIENGVYTFVPVGDYSEAHHSSCYRIFNTDREIEAHKYEPAATIAPLLSESDWLALVQKSLP
ncbi:M48 family metalloprotease [Oligoflexus tunisiensis]|uniref:M48 family metalloprotease n=1 Tax=Oligoflexus tunisiensis TaxID=708132 RepID=UPI00159EF7F6|nr:M48 family metalloprotease [Oligoflexus tunisiensis]